MQTVTFAIQLDNSVYNEQFYMNLSDVESKATKNKAILSYECTD